MSRPDAVAALAAERVAELRHQIDYLARCSRRRHGGPRPGRPSRRSSATSPSCSGTSALTTRPSDHHPANRPWLSPKGSRSTCLESASSSRGGCRTSWPLAGGHAGGRGCLTRGPHGHGRAHVGKAALPCGGPMSRCSPSRAPWTGTSGMRVLCGSAHGRPMPNWQIWRGLECARGGLPTPGTLR
jgi:hypothetical protein